jgi:hypothetical protein
MLLKCRVILTIFGLFISLPQVTPADRNMDIYTRFISGQAHEIRGDMYVSLYVFRANMFKAIVNKKTKKSNFVKFRQETPILFKSS